MWVISFLWALLRCGDALRLIPRHSGWESRVRPTLGDQEQIFLGPTHYQLPVSLQCSVYMEVGVLEILQDADGSDTVTEPETTQMPFGSLKHMEAE